MNKVTSPKHLLKGNIHYIHIPVLVWFGRQDDFQQVLKQCPRPEVVYTYYISGVVADVSNNPTSNQRNMVDI